MKTVHFLFFEHQYAWGLIKFWLGAKRLVTGSSIPRASISSRIWAPGDMTPGRYDQITACKKVKLTFVLRENLIDQILIRKDFLITPYIYYACRVINYEDNSNSLRYWIYTLIITTYGMNKRGFDCEPSHATSRASFRRFSASLSHFPPFFLPYYPGSLRCFFSFISCTPSGLEALTFRIHLTYQSLFYTTTPRDSVENYPSKSMFYFTWLVSIPKNLHSNLPIHVFNACCTPHENMHCICGSLVNKR